MPLLLLIYLIGLGPAFISWFIFFFGISNEVNYMKSFENFFFEEFLLYGVLLGLLVAAVWPIVTALGLLVGPAYLIWKPKSIKSRLEAKEVTG